MAAGKQMLGTDIRGQLRNTTPTMCPKTGKATDCSGEVEGLPQHNPSSLQRKVLEKGPRFKMLALLTTLFFSLPKNPGGLSISHKNIYSISAPKCKPCDATTTWLPSAQEGL